MCDIKKTLKIILVIIGTIIGAGFASGKEIYIFFVKYGINGIVGAIVSSILMGIIIYFTIEIIKNDKIENNSDFVKKITQNKEKSALYMIIKNIINIFLLISFWIMCAGFCTFFKQEFNIKIIISSIVIAILSYIFLIKNIEGIEKLNLIIVPIMICIMLYISIKNCEITEIINKSTIVQELGISHSLKAIFKAILYTSYNSIVLIPIIISISKKVKNKKQSKQIAIISTIIIFILIIGVFQILLKTDINIQKVEIPILKILNNYNNIEKVGYLIVIIAAIFTSAISAGYGVLESIENKNKYKKITILICILQIPISHIGFGNLVEMIYPIFGLIGIIQIFLIIKEKVKIRTKKIES